jgi:hypothetical protein
MHACLMATHPYLLLVCACRTTEAVVVATVAVEEATAVAVVAMAAAAVMAAAMTTGVAVTTTVAVVATGTASAGAARHQAAAGAARAAGAGKPAGEGARCCRGDVSWPRKNICAARSEVTGVANMGLLGVCQGSGGRQTEVQPS